MGISPYPSSFVLPIISKPYPSIFGFLCSKFPQISEEVWRERVISGKVHYSDGAKITLNSLYKPHDRIFYYREVENEPTIPFKEKILFENDHILVVDKPHFLPVIPAGSWIEETLIYRLKKRYNCKNLVPINRIDRETAGLVMISKLKESRDAYQSLFRNNSVEKEYEAICEGEIDCSNKSWSVKNRLVKGEPWFRMKSVDGVVNAETSLELISHNNQNYKFRLFPKTGKKHQLRLHLAFLGFKILNDRYYPDLLPEQAVNFEKPLQLLAKRVKFVDPIEKTCFEFKTEQTLKKTF